VWKAVYAVQIQRRQSRILPTNGQSPHFFLADNPTLAVVISVEAAHVDNTILRDYLTSEVALEKPEIGSTDPNIPIDNNCTDDTLHLGMPGGSGDYEDECDKGDDSPRLNPRGLTWQQVMSIGMRVTMAMMRMQMRYMKHCQPMMDQRRMWRTEGIVLESLKIKHGNDADADEEEEASQADDRSTQNV